MTHQSTYQLLKSAGHSPAKALEIILDAVRGSEHALLWIRVLFDMRRSILGRLP